ARAGRDLPRDDREDGALGEGQARHRRVEPLRRADREGDPEGRTHRIGRRRQDLRAAGGEGVPDPDRRRGSGSGHAGRGTDARLGPRRDRAYGPVPVDPKPPAPRALPGSSSTTSHVTRTTGATTSCAMRMPRSITTGSAPRLTSATLTSPR